jgi:hypothetical protein
MIRKMHGMIFHRAGLMTSIAPGKRQSSLDGGSALQSRVRPPRNSPTTALER